MTMSRLLRSLRCKTIRNLCLSALVIPAALSSAAYGSDSTDKESLEIKKIAKHDKEISREKRLLIEGFFGHDDSTYSRIPAVLFHLIDKYHPEIQFINLNDMGLGWYDPDEVLIEGFRRHNKRPQAQLPMAVIKMISDFYLGGVKGTDNWNKFVRSRLRNYPHSKGKWVNLHLNYELASQYVSPNSLTGVLRWLKTRNGDFTEIEGTGIKIGNEVFTLLNYVSTEGNNVGLFLRIQNKGTLEVEESLFFNHVTSENQWRWYDNNQARYRDFDLGENELKITKEMEAAYHGTSMIPYYPDLNLDTPIMSQLAKRIKTFTKVMKPYVFRFSMSATGGITNIEQIAINSRSSQFPRDVKRLPNPNGDED